MLNTIRVLLGIIVIVLSINSLINKNYDFIHLTLFALGVLTLITGIVEFKAKRKTNAIISILAAAFVIFVTIYIFWS